MVSNFLVSCSSTHEDLFNDVSISYCCIIDIDKARVLSFLGVQTDRHSFGILIWKHVSNWHTKISTQSSKLRVSCQKLAICIPWWRGCIIKTKASYSFEECDTGTDRINFGMYGCYFIRSLKRYSYVNSYQSGKIKLVGDKENDMPPLLH